MKSGGRGVFSSLLRDLHDKNNFSEIFISKLCNYRTYVVIHIILYSLRGIYFYCLLTSSNLE